MAGNRRTVRRLVIPNNGPRRVAPTDPRLIVSRRRFLGGGAAGAAAMALGPAFLAACGDDDGGSTSAGGGGGGGESSDRLRISNWPLYISEDFIPKFEEASGLSVTYTEDLNDNEEWFAKIREPLSNGQDIGADLAVPTEYLAARLISLGWLAELDDANIPNKGNLRPDLLDSTADEERRYTLPYMSGMVGLAYNRALTGRDITSIEDMWDPAFAGQVSLFSDVQDGLGMIMQSLGDDPAEPTTEAVQRAADKVAEEKDRGQIRRFTGNDYTDDLAAGNLAIAQAYSGDVVQLALDNPDLSFVVPESGGTTFVDTMVIPTTTRNKAGAEEFMNFVYDRDNYAELIVWVQYVPVLSDMTEALEAIDPEVASNPLINPPQETLDRLASWPILEDDVIAEYTTIYSDVTEG
jgi:spermidine/putrescine transport system substrate-binding protein